MAKYILATCITAIATFFHFLFGKLSWNAPPWIKYLHSKAVASPKSFWGKTIVVIVVFTALAYALHWYQHRPQPEQIIAQITPPKIMPNEKGMRPDDLNINFGMIVNGSLNNKPVAPINLINQTLNQGITMNPSLPGKWTWQSDSHLTFTPEVDWPAGQTFTLTFTKDFFTTGTRLADYHYTFTTLPFELVIAHFNFYQDPVNPAVRQAVATIDFSYAVDPASFENSIDLLWQGSKEHINYTVSYDEHKRAAYIRSQTLTLPSTERYLELTLAKGIKPLEGPSTTANKETASVLIPDASSYFKMKHVATSIVRNPKDRPEQVLTLETTVGVTQDALKQALHAYLLPKDYPANAAEEAKANYLWKDPGEVTPEVLAQATPLDLQVIPTDRDYATLHSYQYHATTPAFIYLKIDKGTRALGDYVLANDYTAILSVPAYPQEISFLHKGALLALGTEQKLSVLVRGLGAVKFNIARVLPDDINHLVTQTGGDFSNPYFIDPNFNQDNISQIFSQIQAFDASDPAKQQYTALDLSHYLTANPSSGGNLGLFLLQAVGWDSARKVPLHVQAKRLILITDLGLVAKDNLDGTHDVFVQSLVQGSPVSNATVSILGKNGLALLTHNTDAQGHVSFPSLNDFTDEREPVVYLALLGNDVAFMPYNRADRQLNYSRFDVGGITSNNQNQAALTAYLFSDRGIYRPGDTAHIGIIVKQPYVMPQPAGLPLQATITDARGTTVKDEKITLNESGYLTFDFQTNQTAPTGQYLVNLYIVKDNHPSSLIGSMTFNVAEFLPDRMRITAHLSQEQTAGWISPTGLKAEVGLWNLYGAPAANHRLAGKVLLTPQAVTFKTFPDYIFIDPLLNPHAPPKVFSDTLPDIRTDEKGQAEWDLKLDRFEKATYQLTVFAEGFEAEGGRSVTTQTTALVSPLAYLVGYKADGDLTYIKEKSVRSVNFIAINPQLKQQTLTEITLQRFKQHPVTTLVKREDGTYHYQSIMQTSQLSSQPFSITAEGTPYTLPTDDLGDFLITIVDNKGNELSRFKYSVVGSGQQPIPRNAELNVQLNKPEFTPGEDIEMQITAPYTGSGLITIERDKVHAYQWFKTDTTASLQKIRLPADFQGNGYVNIAFVRDINSPEIFMSPLSYRVLPFSVTHKEHDIKVDLSLPDLVQPGQDLTITYQSDKPGKIIVFAVDEGILQVSRYQTPDPLKFFFQKQALEVTTSQIVDQLLPKFMADRELSAVGGDNGEAALIKNLNPFKRKTEAPVVYWSGIVDTDSTPRQVVYNVPDYFNGSLRVMAVAVASNAVGAATKSAEVRGDFVINPNVPTFVAPGDTFDITVGVANNVKGSGAKAKVTVEMTSSSQLSMVGPNKQTLTIPEGQEQSAHFSVRANDQLGSTTLQFVARMGDKSNRLSSSLSVRPAMAYATSIKSGYSDHASLSLPLDHPLYPEYRTVEASASTSPLILVAGLQRYLNEYPYGCVEQLVSKAFPLLVMADQPWFISDTKIITDKIQQTVQMLGQRQMSNGGFNYWPEVGTTQGNDFASIYAMHFLTEAKAQNQNVPSDIFSSGIAFLKDFVTREITSLDEARLQAYAIYILTRNEIVTTNYLTHLQLTLDKHPDYHWQQDITSVYLASVYQLLKNTAEAERLITYYKPQNKQASATTDFYNQSIAQAEYLYLIAKHFPTRLQNISNDVVLSLVDALNNDSMSTVLSSYTSLALAVFHPFYSLSNDALLSISETLSDGKQNALSASNGLYQKVEIAQAARTVNFINPKKQGYFYQLVQAGFDKSLPDKAIKQGIEVYRELLTIDNKPVEITQLGDDIIVRIRARAIDNQYHDNIALVDLLPGGFEVVRDSIHIQNMDYVDAREDRVIYFGSIGPDSKEITYRIKATNTGKFTVPPMFGMAMYNPMIKSLGVASSITVNADRIMQ
jgi:alpha-2-macroglobulin